MFAKRLLQKASKHPQHKVQHDNGISSELDIHVAVHYGIPSTASLLAFDPIQCLLAIATLDGRIKVIGGDNIEGLLISPKKVPYKFLEFLTNKGSLVSISNDNEIQVWNLESRHISCCMPWESNITAFSLIIGSYFMYLGDEHGLVSVLKYDMEAGKLLQLPYHISSDSITEAAGFSFANPQPIVGVVPQPCSSGNRVLIAYVNGLLVLWDVLEAGIVVVKGDKDLQLKDGVVKEDTSCLDDTVGHHLEDKEIGAVCWTSFDGSIVAVGYIDGDILFWNTSSPSSMKGQQAGLSSNVVKLQLSTAERRLPVIVLHWKANNRSHNGHDGQLFVYGGDEIGSEEVISVLSLEWSSEMETLRCVGRINLTLSGSFADMILLPTAGATGSGHNAALFVLTNPGQLQLYDDSDLSVSMSEQEKELSVSAVEFPAVIPTADPYMTVAKLILLPTGVNFSKALSQIVSPLGSKFASTGSLKWPLTGGVHSRLSLAEDNKVERLYIAGYQDGSVRIWDATYPVFSLICVLVGKVQGLEVAGSSASVSKLDFCFLTLSLAIGNECGLVRVYHPNSSLDEVGLHFVTENKHEVHILPQGKGFHCSAIFSLLSSPIRALQFSNSGAKLAVGYECGRIAVLDVNTSSFLFLTELASGSSSPILSMTWQTLVEFHNFVKSPKHSGSKIPGDSVDELIFILAKDANVTAVDVGTGIRISHHPLQSKKSTAISMYAIEGPQQSSNNNMDKNESVQESTQFGMKSDKSEHDSSSESAYSGKMLLESLVLLCFEDSLRLYHSKSVIQGENRPIHKVKLTKPCCWTTVFKKDEKFCGLVLLYQSGEIEIR